MGQSLALWTHRQNLRLAHPLSTYRAKYNISQIHRLKQIPPVLQIEDGEGLMDVCLDKTIVAIISPSTG